MANYAYLRVSTIQQNEARQREAMEEKKIDEYYVDKVSGKNIDRPQLQKLLSKVKKGDTIYIKDLSRLARSTQNLLELIGTLTEKEVTLISLSENIDLTTAQGKFLITMFGALAEMEREMLLERQAEGIEIAKLEGKYKGRQMKKLDNFEAKYQKFCEGNITKTELASILKTSRVTLNKHIEEYENGTLYKA